MLKLSWIELLLKGIPEGFLDVLAIYVFTRTKVEVKKYIITSLAFIVFIYLIRLLPINYGVNTMISILVFVFVFVLYYKLEFSKVLKAAILLIIFVFISEELNMLILLSIFGENATKDILNDPVSKGVTSLPSTIIFAAIIIASYFILKKMDQKKKDRIGEDSKKISE